MSDPRLSGPEHLPFSGSAGFWLYADDVAYSRDRRWIAVYAEGSDQHGDLVDAHQLIWDANAPEGPPAVVGSMPSLAIALSPDGRLLYVLTQQPALAVIDVTTGAIVNSHDLPPGLVPLPTFDINPAEQGGDLSDILEISPDGSVVALAVGDDVVLLDSATLTERLRLRGVHGRVLSVRFSPDGRLLATGSADRMAVVWEVAAGTGLKRLAGHGGPVLALAFSPGGDTLYTGGADHRVLVWDLAGLRRFVAMVAAVDAPSTRAEIAVPSPDGRDIVFVGSPTKNGSLQFFDVSTGVLDPAVADPYGDPLAVWLPPDRGHGHSLGPAGVGPQQPADHRRAGGRRRQGHRPDDHSRRAAAAGR